MHDTLSGTQGAIRKSVREEQRSPSQGGAISQLPWGPCFTPHCWNLENPGGILNHFSMGSSKGLIYSLPTSQLQMAEPDEFEKMQKDFLKREGGPLFEMEDGQLGWNGKIDMDLNWATGIRGEVKMMMIKAIIMMMRMTVVKILSVPHSSFHLLLTTTLGRDTICIQFYRWEKAKVRKFNYFAQNHTAHEWQSQDLSPSLAPKPVQLNMAALPFTFSYGLIIL